MDLHAFPRQLYRLTMFPYRTAAPEREGGTPLPPVGVGRDTAGSPKYRRLPYAAYSRVSKFLASIDGNALEGSPPRVADVAFDNLTAGTRDQLIAALSALGLMDGRFASTELIRIVQGDEGTRREVLRRRVHEALAGAIELMDAGEPLHAIDRWIEEHGYSGGTVRRVRSFLLAAMEDLDIPADLRPYRVRARRRTHNIGADARGQYAGAGVQADWREARSDEYVEVLIRYLKNSLKDVREPESARGYEWLLDRIEQFLHAPSDGTHGEGEARNNPG